LLDASGEFALADRVQARCPVFFEAYAAPETMARERDRVLIVRQNVLHILAKCPGRDRYGLISKGI
jgi:hypothetical protein